VRPECTTWGLQSFNVQKAKELIVKSPREVKDLDLEKNGKEIREFLADNFRTRPNVDWSTVDVSIPVLYAETDEGKLPIDGRHRLLKALDENKKSIPVIWFTKEEFASIRLV